MKKNRLVSIILLVLSIVPLSVNATDYTNSNAQVNSNYNRSSAIWYAGTYITTPNTSYGVAYNNNIENDCTNFMSQILKCGTLGDQVYGTKNTGTSADSIQSWYFTNLTNPNRSTSWTGANEFRRHWANVNNYGTNRAYAMKTWTVVNAKNNVSQIYSYINNADVLQYSDASGVTQHTQLVYAKYATGEINMAQHTGNGYRWLQDSLNTTSYTYVSAIRIKKDV